MHSERDCFNTGASLSLREWCIDDPFRGLTHVSLCNRAPTCRVSAPCRLCRHLRSMVADTLARMLFSSRERTVPIVFRCVSVIRHDVRRIRIGLIGRRRNTLCYGRPAAEPPRNGAGVPNLQQSEIIQPAGCNGRCIGELGCGLCCAYRNQSVSRVVAVCHRRTGVSSNRSSVAILHGSSSVAQ